MKRGLVALLVLTAASPVARAQSPGAAPALQGEARLAEAQRLFEEARALLARDEWRAACALFEASTALHEDPAAVVKVARCRAHDGRLAAAIEAYERALALGPWAELDRLARAELFEVERRAPSIRVRLVEPASGVTLYRNGRIVRADARSRLWTDVGVLEHFWAEAPGYVGASHDLAASAEGEEMLLEIKLARPPEKPPPPVDPVLVGGWVSVGGAAIALGVGAGFGVQYLVRRGSLYDDCKPPLPDGRHVCPPEITARYDDTVAARTRAGVLLGVGGALAAVGIGLVAAGRSRAARSTVSAFAFPGGAGLRGVF